MQYVFLKTCTVFCSIRCQCDAAGERANAILPVQLIERGFTAVVYLESRVKFWSLIFKKDERGNVFTDGLVLGKGNTKREEDLYHILKLWQRGNGSLPCGLKRII